MLRIIYSTLKKEAKFLSKKLKTIFNEKIVIHHVSVLPRLGREKVLLLMEEELIMDDDEDDWVFGYAIKNRVVISVYKLKSRSKKKYYDRLLALAIHELGHTRADPAHYRVAYWVNAKTNHKQWLGKHCTDNKCIMYEIVDLTPPCKNDGYLKLGRKKYYDAGLDNLIARRYKDWFCKKCK